MVQKNPEIELQGIGMSYNVKKTYFELRIKKHQAGLEPTASLNHL